MSPSYIASFWFPLATTWLMMAAEGPLVAAVIARMPDATVNLAAFGVAGAFASLVEAPILMLLAASTTLVRDQSTFRSLRRFAYALNIGLTLVMVLVLVPPVFAWIERDLLDLPAEVGELSYGALALLIPWPAAIGYRRFYQGLLVRHNQTRWVAYGTVFRLVGMMGTALVIPRLVSVRGAHVGAAALSIGVMLEALAAGHLGKRVAADLDTPGPDRPSGAAGLSTGHILRFYVPLATTSILPMAVQPMLTFFMGHGRLPVESLAVYPVASNFVFIFRCTGVSLQEVTITLLGERRQHFRELRNFAIGLACVACGALVLTAYSGLAVLWYGSVTALPGSLTALASTTTQVLAILPLFTVLQAFQRGVLVSARHTAPVSWATMLEVVVVASVMSVGMLVFDAIGAVSAAIAVVSGQLVANGFLRLMVRRTLALPPR